VQALDICILKCCIVESGPSHKHLELGGIVFCHNILCHLQFMKLHTCRPHPVWVSKGPFNVYQEFVQGVHLGHPVDDWGGFVACPYLCHSSTHEGKGIQDFCLLIHKGVGLHGNCNPDGTYKLFGFVSVPIEGLGFCCPCTSTTMLCQLDRYVDLGVCGDSLGHCRCRS